MEETYKAMEGAELAECASRETLAIRDLSQDGLVPAGSFNMRKRIGSTSYEVEVHFNPDSRETLDEKILRLARGEALNESAGGSEKNK